MVQDRDGRPNSALPATKLHPCWGDGSQVKREWSVSTALGWRGGGRCLPGSERLSRSLCSLETKRQTWTNMKFCRHGSWSPDLSPFRVRPLSGPHLPSLAQWLGVFRCLGMPSLAQRFLALLVHCCHLRAFYCLVLFFYEFTKNYTLSPTLDQLN